MRPQRLEAGPDADAVAEHLARDGRLVGPERVEDAELEPVHAEPVGELVVELLHGDRGLRHAEAAEGAGRHEMGVHGAASSAR